MQLDSPALPPSADELIRVRADAARQVHELDLVRAELSILQPSEWRSPAARAFAESVAEISGSLARARAALGEGIQALAARS